MTTSSFPYIIAALIAGTATVLAATISAILSYRAQKFARSIDKSVNGIQPGENTIRENVALLVEKQDLAHQRFELLADKVDNIAEQNASIARRVGRVEKAIQSNSEEK